MLDWNDFERRLMGDAWVGSRIAAHLGRLCDEIGVRWAGTEAEATRRRLHREQFDEMVLERSSRRNI